MVQLAFLCLPFSNQFSASLQAAALQAGDESLSSEGLLSFSDEGSHLQDAKPPAQLGAAQLPSFNIPHHLDQVTEMESELKPSANEGQLQILEVAKPPSLQDHSPQDLKSDFSKGKGDVAD